MNTRCRALLACAALLTVPLAPAACTSMGQGMAERAARANSARYAPQRNPQFSVPALQSLVIAFAPLYAYLALFAFHLGFASGTPFPLPLSSFFLLFVHSFFFS